MSYQPQEFTAPSGPVRRESALQRQMAEFDAKKAAESRSVSYSDDTRDRSPSSKSKRNGTPHPKGTSPHAPPSPDRDSRPVVRHEPHTPPRDRDGDYHKNIHTSGGNGRDKEEKWVGNNLPQVGLHGKAEGNLDYADQLSATVDKKTGDTKVEWNGEGAPPIRHHHQWTDDDVPVEAPSKKSSKTKKYKNAAGDHVEEAEGSDQEISTHHVWRPDSEAQAAYDAEHKKKSKSKKSKHSRKSSREEQDRPVHSGDESDSDSYQTRKYINEDGDEVEEAVNEKMKIRHNHTWRD